MMELQERPIFPVLFALRLSEGKYTIDTDAFHKQILWILLQDQPHTTELQIWYYSTSLIKAEQE